MKVNYVLMYGTPYLKYKEFEKFDDISKYLVNKGICNYRIFEPMEDLKEVEMIHLENDVRVLEDKIKQLQSQLKAKEEAMNKLKEWLDQEYEHCDKIGNPAIGCAMGQIRRVKAKIEELEILSKGENK